MLYSMSITDQEWNGAETRGATLNHELAFILTLSWVLLRSLTRRSCPPSRPRRSFSRVFRSRITVAVVGITISLFPACLDLSESILFRFSQSTFLAEEQRRVKVDWL